MLKFLMAYSSLAHRETSRTRYTFGVIHIISDFIDYAERLGNEEKRFSQAKKSFA